LCEVIASELQVPIQVTLGHMLRNPADLNELLLNATDKSIVAVDEADLMPVPVQTALMVAISSGRLFLPAGGSVQSIPLANMTFLLATTEEHGLLGPATQRFNTLRFSYYCEEDLRNIVAVRARSLGWGIADEAIPPIAERSRGTPRIALKILQASRSVCRAEGEETISLAHLERACRLTGIDAMGLNEATDLAYMRLLQESQDGTQLSVLASRLGIPSKTVSAIIEPFLLRAGLMEKGKQSKRYLTAKGKEHLTGGKKDE
jgi:Holliday junction DNA helicase RuvB